jgi:hypothetical protein
VALPLLGNDSSFIPIRECFLAAVLNTPGSGPALERR